MAFCIKVISKAIKQLASLTPSSIGKIVQSVLKYVVYLAFKLLPAWYITTSHSVVFRAVRLLEKLQLLVIVASQSQLCDYIFKSKLNISLIFL